jgi:hypothetical protein
MLGAFTFFHVLLSLVGIGSGFVVLFGLLTSKWFVRWNTLFLATTAATSVTGFLFPFHCFLPSHAVGTLSLLVLAIAVLARYRFHLVGGWRKTYAITALVALYFNVFVLIAQMFQKVPALKALAPTQSEPPFQMAQLTILVLFVALIIRAAVKFQSAPLQAVQSASGDGVYKRA